jgi:hypothetical protein
MADVVIEELAENPCCRPVQGFFRIKTWVIKSMRFSDQYLVNHLEEG